MQPAIDQLPVFWLKGSRRPKTNAERQQAFRDRNPDYNRKYKARMRAAVAARVAQRKAAEAAERALAEKMAIRPPLALPAPPVRLMLPAPVETIEIPGMTTIGAIPVREAVALPIRIDRSTEW